MNRRGGKHVKHTKQGRERRLQVISGTVQEGAEQEGLLKKCGAGKDREKIPRRAIRKLLGREVWVGFHNLCSFAP